ncbi:hypothetical protein B0H16DRAFT_1685538 [Mycena metata]|uniref:Uncharacterized protein n=1 Tax=Mycena metata TaxID=1033252 RepID=A0AAD7NR22_9AGAR|nr:hypothetical protein B0H16DRAFT_1685538 [Mycena metata]
MSAQTTRAGARNGRQTSTLRIPNSVFDAEPTESSLATNASAGKNFLRETTVQSVPESEVTTGETRLDPATTRLREFLVEGAVYAARVTSLQPSDAVLTPEDVDALDNIRSEIVDALVTEAMDFTEEILKLQREAQAWKQIMEFHDEYNRRERERIQKRRQALAGESRAAGNDDLPDESLLTPALARGLRVAQAPPGDNAERLKTRIDSLPGKITEIRRYRELGSVHIFGAVNDAASIEELPRIPALELSPHALLRALAAVDMKRLPEKESDAVKLARRDLDRQKPGGINSPQSR